MIIIGITGTLGAGKGTIVKYLVEQYGFLHFSVRSFLKEEIAKKDLPLNRDSMVKVANQLRKENSPSYITDCLFEKAVRARTNCIIESIRTPGEIFSLKKNTDFVLWAIDAKKEIRYQRIKIRSSSTDHVSFEEFIISEQREFTSTDPNKQNLKKCIEMADHTFNNDESIEALNKQVDIQLKLLINKNYE